MITPLARIPGGHAAYREAVDRAFCENICNPCVRWSLRRGFTTESDLTPVDDDQITICRANYSADTGDQSMTGSRGEYNEVRAMILAFQAAIDAGESQYHAARAAYEREMEF